MIEMYSVNGIVDSLRSQSKIVYLLYITLKVIEHVFLVDSPKIPRISFFFFCLMFPAFRANVLAFKSLGWSPASLFCIGGT